MALEKLTVLSQASVDKLKVLNKENINTNLLDLSFDEMVDSYQLLVIQSDTSIDTSIQLEMPRGKSQEENCDLDNCKLISRCLPQMTDLEGTDERVWITLALRNFKNYAEARWHRDPKVEPWKHRENHWFAAAGVRERMRNNAVGRLWWYQQLANRLEGRDKWATLEKIFFNSEYRSSLLERNTSSAITNVVQVIVDITEKHEKKGVEYKRESFREFMKEITFLAGRSRLVVLSREQLAFALEPLYLKAYGIG
mgnify:CR=1 FL=1